MGYSFYFRSGIAVNLKWGIVSISRSGIAVNLEGGIVSISGSGIAEFNSGYSF